MESTEANNTQGAVSRGMPVPDVILDAVIEVVKNHELSLGLEDDVIKALCVEAVHEGTLDDNAWLEEKLISIRSGETVIETESVTDKINSFEEELAQIVVTEPQMIESEDQLKETVRLHEVWMDSVLNPSKDDSGQRANFEGMNLSGYDLSNANLSCANFRNSSLVGTNFSGANLSRAILENADAQGANFSGAKLKKTNLENALLSEIDIEDADLKGAVLTGTILEGKTLVKAEPKTEETIDPFMMI
ncbi:pentapeptide repeat-containing protein [bacterium]|nr:pentapeptide repeat-containing protein [bacterium]